MTNWKEKTFITKYDEKLGTWITTTDDLQCQGDCSDHWLIDSEKEIAAGLSLLDLLGFDIEILADKIGVIKGD